MYIEDKLLFNEIRNRNLKIYESVFSTYYPQLVRFANRYILDFQECEDIVQSLFIHFWENAENMDLKISLKSYFFQSVKNRCLNYLRDYQIRDRHNLLYIEALLDQVDHDDLYDPEIFDQIKEAIDSLPKQMAEIFKLKYIECKRINEIAQLNKVSENTVKTQLLRAKNKMRKILLETTSIKFLF